MTAERETGPDQCVELTFCIFFFLSHNHSPPSERSCVVGIIQLFAVIRTSTNDVIETRIIYLRKKYTSLTEEESPTNKELRVYKLCKNIYRMYTVCMLMCQLEGGY